MEELANGNHEAQVPTWLLNSRTFVMRLEAGASESKKLLTVKNEIDLRSRCP